MENIEPPPESLHAPRFETRGGIACVRVSDLSPIPPSVCPIPGTLHKALSEQPGGGPSCHTLSNY